MEQETPRYGRESLKRILIHQKVSKVLGDEKLLAGKKPDKRAEMEEMTYYTIMYLSSNVDEESQTIILLRLPPIAYQEVKHAIKYGKDVITLEDVLATLKSKDFELQLENESKKEEVYLVRGRSSMKADEVLRLLALFEKASGQQVNYAKSSVFFSTNTTPQGRDVICSRMGIQPASDNSKYLGLPSIMNRNKNVVLGYLKDKVRQRIQSWDNKFLSRAGKEVLIKSVLQSLPSYAMNVFLLTEEICKDIERMMSKFWWRSKSTETSGIYWISWKRLGREKEKGGMGFRCLRDFNIALLAKQGWRLLVKEESLVAKVFKARYYPNGNYFSAEIGNNPSYIWRSIKEAQSVVKIGTRRCIGSGQTTNILNEPWLNDDQHPFITSSHPALVNQKVSALVKPTVNDWDEEVLRDVLTERDYKLVLAIPLTQSFMEDKWYWFKENSGLFTVRSAYQLIQDSKPMNGQSDNSGFWRSLWQLKVPPKVKNFLWRACTNCLPTCFQLSLRKVPIEVTCPICHGETETILHILVDFPFSYNCWRTAAIPRVASAATSFAGWFDDGLKLWTKEDRTGAAMLCWSIWNNRNNSVWNSKQSSVEEVVSIASLNFVSWNNAQNQSHISPSGHGQQGRYIEHWTRPIDPYIKVNVDGAIFSNEECFGFGMVARTASGSVIEAVQIRKIGNWSPLLVEAMGLKEALSWIKQKD
uniref:Reverse transcriptase zinc-binding domain-containing protein n=1 Tax=Cannabis sativa TaxID=3483 RepID=A0A803PFI6_CANSA